MIRRDLSECSSKVDLTVSIIIVKHCEEIVSGTIMLGFSYMPKVCL